MSIEQHPFTSNRWLQNINSSLLIEKWFINKNAENEVLSFAYMPNKKVSSIFLGTFPIWEITVGPSGNQNFEFFYGSIVNDFWNCIGSISELPANTVNNRMLILDNYNIGMTDILETIDRNPVNCNSDNCLTSINYNNILNLKEFFPNLKNIFITSGGKGAIGNLQTKRNVGTWFKDSIRDQNIHGFDTSGFVKAITVNNIDFNLIYLYSPSGDANRSIQRIINSHNNFGIDNLNISEFRKLQWGYFIKKYHLSETANEKINVIHNTVVNNRDLLTFFTN